MAIRSSRRARARSAKLLNTAPELLERVSALTERLTALLSDRNQESLPASSTISRRSAAIPG